MGNEMGNRNTSSVAEQESIENQISSEPPSDVVAAMADDMPTSMSSTKGSEDPSDSALNQEPVIKREASSSALDAENSSATEGDENARAMESEDIQQATTISNVGYLPAASATGRIDAAGENENERADHKEAVMLAEECIKVEDDSLKTSEISFNDKECNGVEHEKAESSKLENAAMQGEDKCFNQAIGVSLLDTKQSYLESEILVDASKTENERVDHKEAVMLAEECIKMKDDSLKTKEIAFKDKECNGSEHEKTESSKLEIAAMQEEDRCFNEAIGVSLLDVKQSYLESEIIIDASKTENERVNHKEAIMLAEECIKVEDDSLKTKEISFNDKECNGSEHEKTEYSNLAIAAMQGEDNGFNEATGVSLLNTKHSYLESEILVDTSKTESNVDGLNGLNVTTNNVGTNTSEATNPGTQNVYADKNVDGLSGLTVNTNNVEMNNSEATNPGTQNGYADKKDENLQVDFKYQNADDDNEPESRDALQSGTQDPAVIVLQSADMQKSTPSQASDNQIGYDKQTISDGRVDLQVHTEHENTSDDQKEIASGNSPEVEKSSGVPNQILFLNENGFDDKCMAHTTASAQESYVNMVESTTIPSYLQSVSEAEEDVNILCLPQKTLPIVESDLVESIKEIEQNICPRSGNLFFMNGDTMMERSSAENGILSRQTFISEMNNGLIPSEMEQCNKETMASPVGVTIKHSSSETDKHELDKKELDVTVAEVMGKATSLQCASEVLQDINASLLHRKEDESCSNVIAVSTATEDMEIPKCLHSTSESIQNEHKEGATNAIAVEIIEEPMTLLSASEAAGDTDTYLLPETKNELCSSENILSCAAEELENPSCKQPTIEGMQNKHDNMASTASVAEEISDSKSSDNRSLHQLHEGEDKSCSTAVVLSDCEIYQQTDKMASSSFVSVTLSDSQVREYNIDNREIGISPLISENNDQAEQIGNELYSEVLEKRISDQHVKNTLGAEVVKPDSFADSIGNTKPSLVELKENASEDLSVPQKQEDVAGTAVYDATKEDIKGLEKRIFDQDVKNNLGDEVVKPDSFTDSIGNTEPSLVESKENASEDLSAPQKQEHVAGTALYDAVKEDIKGLEKRISDQDVKSNLGAEVVKPDSFTDSIGNTEPSLVESKENESENLSEPQKQEDVAGTALSDAAKEDIKGLEKRISDQDVKNTLGAEVVKPDSFTDSIGNTEPSLVELKENASKDLSASLKQEDVAGTALYDATKEDINQDNTGSRSRENVALPTADKDLPIWPSDGIEAGADRRGDAAQDITGKDTVLTGDTPGKQETHSSPDNQVQPSEYLSCPKLESWNEQGDDDLNTPLLPTAKGLHEEKVETVSQVNSLPDDPKISLERTESGKSRTPLRNLFAEDSVSVSGGSLKSTEQGGSHEKAVQDVWGSPARLVASPTSREKQKTRSIFSQCICCTAIH